ncbi:CEP57 [Bugula neritina]|uniref:CEP57 n=1 Tax=Bugula neritina TaxID=10212 RepID=A0A7J7K347_BUGNE|nr:CEP57 [Bugula neritina]
MVMIPSRSAPVVLDSDEASVFQTPSKGLIDTHRHNWRESTSPSRGLPTSQRDNVVDALKNIQDRIRALEVERTTAEENLKGLSKETTYYRKSLERMRAECSPRTTPRSRIETSDYRTSPGLSPGRCSSRHQNDIQEQLRSADSRCELLDKQLEYMRKMLNEAEAEKRLAYERSEQMMRLRSANTGQELRLQMEKIAGMEREHQRLQASQALAQNRIRDLEKVLEETRNQQRASVSPNLSAELRSAAKTNQILIDKLSPPVSPNKHKPDSPAKQKKRRRPKKCKPSHPVPGQHYRLNLADIPFVVGQSTAPSHRVGTNVQNVIAKMKSHNPDLCAAAADRRRPRSAPPRSKRCANRPKLIVSSTATDNSESECELQDMMDQLAEEYTHMSAEHHELTRECDSAVTAALAAEIQHEIEKLEIRMSTKAEQIARLGAYQNKLNEKRNKPDSSSSKSMQARNAYKVPSSSTTGEVQVTTTIKTKGCRADRVQECRPPSRQENLRTLNTMKTLKTRLKPDDLHWTN